MLDDLTGQSSASFNEPQHCVSSGIADVALAGCCWLARDKEPDDLKCCLLACVSYV